MLRKNFTFLMLVVVATSWLYAESSLYGFGMEEETAQAAQTTRAPLLTMAAMRQRIAEQDERIDGLSSMIEGLSSTLSELQGNSLASRKTIGDETKNTVLLKELGIMIDKINEDYVSKTEFKRALASKNIHALSKDSKTKNIKSKAVLSDRSAKSLYSEGVRNFVKKRYSEAKKRFIITDAKGYKPAASNYYLGEISYYTKKYEDAIFYFKKSAGLNDQASYIDTLLLHTAVSLEKNGETSQAKDFYENIISNYPNKKSATIAKQKIRKL